MKTTRKLLIAAAVQFFLQPVFAAEVYEFYDGTRELGMGGAAVATVNDETALIANPAALAKLRSSYITVIDPEMDGSTNDLAIMNKAGGDSVAFTDAQKLLGWLAQSPDKYFHATGQVFPSFVVPNFGIGLHAKYRYNAEIVSATNTYDVNYVNDYALVLGFSARLFDGRIKIGFNGRLVDRVEVVKSLPAGSTGLRWEDLAAEGVGLASDVGLIITAPWKWLPTLAGVLRDAGTTQFEMNDGFVYQTNVRPQYVKQTVDVGISVSPVLGNKTRMQISGEYRDVLTSGDETDQARRIHAGLEVNFGDVFFLRGGMNQRYWTAGFEFAINLFQFQVASYGEEIGTADVNREDRRYIGKMAIRF